MLAGKNQKYDNLIARCKAFEPTPCAVAHPCDESSLRGAAPAAEMGLLRPILVGPQARIAAVSAKAGLDIAACERVDAPHSQQADLQPVGAARRLRRAERVCSLATWLGLALDVAANRAGGPRISTADSRAAAWVLPTNEELMIARQTRRVLG